MILSFFRIFAHKYAWKYMSNTQIKKQKSSVAIWFRDTYKEIRIFVACYLLYLPYVIAFNLKYLPLSQSWKLPIWVRCRNRGAWKLNGKIRIDAKKVKCGMIKMGFKHDFYYKKGISYKNVRGLIIFKGSCQIGNESMLEVHPGAVLTFGDGFGASCSKIFCAQEVTFGDGTLLGFGTTVMDSDFHYIVDMIGRRFINPSAPVRIGNHNWVGCQTLIMKGTQTPDCCIIGARAVLNKKYKVPKYSLIGNTQSAQLIEEDYLLVPNNNPQGDPTRKLTQEEIDAMKQFYDNKE